MNKRVEDSELDNHLGAIMRGNVGDEKRRIASYSTTGDGNCFFHSVFGSYDDNSKQYKTANAQEMRKEWHRFLNQFDSLGDPKMPSALKDMLSLMFHDVFPGQESHFNTSGVYKKYLDDIQTQDYFIRVDEVVLLASLANVEIEVFREQRSGNQERTDLSSEKYVPNATLINSDYQPSNIWGSARYKVIHHKGQHFSKAEIVPEQVQINLQQQIGANQKFAEEGNMDQELQDQIEGDSGLAEKVDAVGKLTDAYNTRINLLSTEIDKANSLLNKTQSQLGKYKYAQETAKSLLKLHGKRIDYCSLKVLNLKEEIGAMQDQYGDVIGSDGIDSQLNNLKKKLDKLDKKVNIYLKDKYEQAVEVAEQNLSYKEQSESNQKSQSTGDSEKSQQNTRDIHVHSNTRFMHNQLCENLHMDNKPTQEQEKSESFFDIIKEILYTFIKKAFGWGKVERQIERDCKLAMGLQAMEDHEFAKALQEKYDHEYAKDLQQEANHQCVEKSQSRENPVSCTLDAVRIEGHKLHTKNNVVSG